MRTFWTEARINTLSTLWREGRSVTAIAAVLGPKVTRGMVIGKVHRIGLDKRRSVCRVVYLPKPRPKKDRKLAPAVAAAPLPPERPAPATALRLTLMELTDQTCKCGLGDPKAADFAFCGLPSKPGSPYCAHHHAICYSSVRTENAKKSASKESRRGELRFEKWAA